MAKKKYLTDTELLEQYRISFDNAKNQSEIATVMAEFGYDSAVIGEGEALLA